MAGRSNKSRSVRLLTKEHQPFSAYRRTNVDEAEETTPSDDIALAEAARRRPRLSRPSFNFALSGSHGAASAKDPLPSQVSVQVDIVKTSHPVGEPEYSIDFPRLSSPLDLTPLDRVWLPHESDRQSRPSFDPGDLEHGRISPKQI